MYATSSRSEEHTSELQSPQNLVCRLLLEKKENKMPLRVEGRTGRVRGLWVGGAGHGVRSARGSHPREPHPSPGAEVRAPLPFFLKKPAPTEIYTLPLHDALPI